MWVEFGPFHQLLPRSVRGDQPMRRMPAGGTSTDCEAAIDGVRFITIPQPKIGIVEAAPNLLLKWPAAAAGWFLEATDSLAPPNWQPVPMDAGVTVDSGVVTFEQPTAGAQKFYRLRRSP